MNTLPHSLDACFSPFNPLSRRVSASLTKFFSFFHFVRARSLETGGRSMDEVGAPVIAEGGAKEKRHSSRVSPVPEVPKNGGTHHMPRKALWAP